MKTHLKRTGALALVLSLTLGLTVPAASAAGTSPSCDETYYATLDPYGQLLDSSVVKTYATGGGPLLTDYGVYDQIINLTDGREAARGEDGSISFDLSGEAPDKFCFEGKTAQPYEEFPWKLSLSYTLNGVPTPAEELGGAVGVVEITLTATPNPLASEYARNNLVLTAASVFNGDDILSLEAPGAQIQLLGNLYAVLYAVLPGEEQSFTLRVGSENFSYSGMIFLAVPATLRQLEQVAQLKEAKEKGEDSYHALNDSLDVILNTLDGMSGSINTAASGLDRLNSARRVVSGGKDTVYDSIDRALAATGPLTASMEPMAGHLAAAQEALTQTVDILGEMNTSAQSLKPELEKLQTTINAIQKDTKALKELAGDAEGYNKRATSIADSLEELLDDLGGDMNSLQIDLYRLRNALKNTKGISKVEPITVGGMSDPAEIQAKIAQVNGLYAQYQAALNAGTLPAGTSFADGIVLGAFQQGYEAKVEEQITTQVGQAYQQKCQELLAAGVPAENLPTLEQFMADPAVQQMITQARAAAMAPEAVQAAYLAFRETGEGKAAIEQANAAAQLHAAVEAMGADGLAEQLKLMETANTTLIPAINSTITEVNAMVTRLTDPTGDVVDELADLCDVVGSGGILDDLSNLAGLARDLLKDCKAQEGTVPDLLERLDELGAMADRVAGTGEEALDQLDRLYALVTQYEPGTQTALSDAQVFTQSASDGISALTEALTSTRELMRDAGPALDEGTRQTLDGLSAALRRAGTGLSQTSTLRSAKSTITGLIEEEWNSHIGEENNLLLMDAAAKPQSLTDPRNQEVTSIQYVMRSQETKAEKPDNTDPQNAAPQEKTTFWQRVKTMFTDIWHSITRLFGGNKE